MSANRSATFRATVIPLCDGHRQPERTFKAYRHGGSPLQAKRYLERAYPYPSYTIPDLPTPVKGAK